jgi:5'-deoxy-5'-methylthioadenosine phosphorylase
MARFGIIGGSGLCDYPGIEISEVRELETPYGFPSAALRLGRLNQREVVFLPRHGDQHSTAPHKINYRANIHALQQLGVSHVLAVAAVGGITEQYGPGTLAVPDQIIDYTYGREQSFFSDDFSSDKHIDFTWPYDAPLRQAILTVGDQLNLNLINRGIYGAVQGPRLETAAEISRMAKDGCHLVGMTGMPEAYLAREAGMAYASLAVVANWAAGITDEVLTMDEIHQTLASGIDNVRAVIAGVIGLR